MKSYGVTIQMKPLKQFFRIVPSYLNIYKMKFGTCLEFSFWALLGVKKVKNYSTWYNRDVK